MPLGSHLSFLNVGSHLEEFIVQASGPFSPCELTDLVSALEYAQASPKLLATNKHMLSLSKLSVMEKCFCPFVELSQPSRSALFLREYARGASHLLPCRQLSFSNSLHTSKEKLSGWGDDSVHEAFSVQARAPEFDLKSSHLFLGTVMCACISVLGAEMGRSWSGQ